MSALKRIGRFLMPGSLRYQLLSRSLFVLAALLLLIGVFQYVFMREFIYRNKAESIQSQIISFPRDAWQKLPEASRGNGDGPGTGSLAPGDGNSNGDGDGNSDGDGDGNGDGDGGPGRHPVFFLPDSSLALIDMYGNLSVISNGHDSASLPKLTLQQYQNAMKQKKGVNWQVIKDDQGEEELLVLQPVEGRGHLMGLVQVCTSTKPLKDVLIWQLLTFLSLSLLALLFGMLGFLPVLRKTLIPLSNMVDTVGRIDSGSLAERFPAHQGQVEIDRLAVSFNSMLERLESSFAAEKEAREQMRRFVADASHELRTPLTSIHGFLEVLLRGAMNQPEQLHRALTSMYGESERINKLVQDLLMLAKLDRAPVMELSNGDLNGIIRDMEPQLKLLAGKRSVSLNLGGIAECSYDPDKMKQVILNLFHNAVQHTDPEKGTVQISTRAVPAGIELAVRDNGTGIGKEHLPHLFDRFYRCDTSRTRKYGGSGLGLSITKSIVEAHGGTIGIESAEGAGSTFLIRLPASGERQLKG